MRSEGGRGGEPNDVVAGKLQGLINQLASRTTSAIAEKLQEQSETATTAALALVRALKDLEASEDDLDKKREVERLRSELLTAQEVEVELFAELEEALGIPLEELERLLGLRPERKEEENRLFRSQLTRSDVAPTAYVDEVLGHTLASLLSSVDGSWLERNRAAHAQTRAPFSGGVLSLVQGLWPGGYRGDVHRFAQALLLAEDYLSGRADYDFFTGSILLPQLAALGLSLPELEKVPGSQERLTWLYRGPSEEVESTIYELLVAAALSRRDWEPEFLPPRPGKKTPDIRLGATPVPVVVECKRQRFLSDYARNEEECAKTIFGAAAERQPVNMAGVFDVSFGVEVHSIDAGEFSECIWGECTKQPWERDFGWGTVRFRPLSPQIRMKRLTRLYSPNYLQTVFGWSVQDPTHDGFWARVQPPGTCTIDEARSALGFSWTVNHPEAINRRCRSILRYLIEAARQIPTGEQGVIYIGYEEGHREEVADARTGRMLERMRSFHHRSTIVLPFVFVNRFYPAPTGDGEPDTIENCVQLYGYGDKTGIEDYPCRVLTPGEEVKQGPEPHFRGRQLPAEPR